MFSKIKDQSGFSLIELVASIVLVSIVILFFLTILPQMNTMNEKNGENLNAANAGKEVLVELKKKSFNQIKTLTLPTSIENETVDIIKSKDSSISNKVIIEGRYKYIDEYFNIVITINEQIEEETLSLRRLKLEIKNDNNNTLTTIHGYLSQ